ncbi:hypothetical protein RND81_09G032200 [Saponaria officinalis]|uniref:Retrotransposon gag domain-containing protein n=1 Tax=Saponaria officinalis TaxID=3572 RepID=A0AAW1IHV8_SAPOF
MVWDELASNSRVPKCTFGAATAFLKEQEEEKVHQFLMGLNDSVYRTLRSNILMEDHIPSFNRVYGIVLRKERHKAMVRQKEERTDEAVFAIRRGSPATRGGRQVWPKADDNAEDQERRCTYCRKRGHDEDDCWTKHGLPANISRGRGRGRSWRGRGAGRGD